MEMLLREPCVGWQRKRKNTPYSFGNNRFQLACPPKAILGLALVWNAVQLSRPQCVLEKEYFCSSIPNDFPEGLTSILFVVTNLGVINSTVFSSPSLASVTSLALANSGITDIEAGAFHAFQSLTKLSLYQNSLTRVSASWLSNPGRLENLTAAQNFIVHIGPDMFSGLSNLVALNLANNWIRDVARGSFKDLAKLKFIDLSGNRLAVLRRAVFDGLTMLPAMKLGGNPWNCSCELQDWGLFLQEMINASLLEDAPDVVCHTPPSLQGVHVWNISDFKCSSGRLPSSGNAFHKVGLPALLACLVFISLLALIIWIWTAKRNNKQVRPSKDIVDPVIGAKSTNCVDSECQQSNKQFKTSQIGTVSRNMRLKVRAKSASAILLQTEFYQRRQQISCSTDPKWDPVTTTPYVSLNNKMYLGRDNLDNFMEVRNYQMLETGNREEFESCYNVGSFLTEVCIETPGMEAEAETEATNPTLQGYGFSERLEDQNDTDNPEPFLYLSIATAPKEQVDVNPPEDRIPKPNGNNSTVLKRTLTWPYERKFWDQSSHMLNIRGSFRAQLLIPSPHLGGTAHSGEREGEEAWLPIHPWKEHDNGEHQVKGEATQLPEEDNRETIGTGTYDPTHPRKDGQRGCGGSQLEPTNETHNRETIGTGTYGPTHSKKDGQRGRGGSQLEPTNETHNRKTIGTGTYGPTHPRKDGQRGCGGSQLEPTKQIEFLVQKEPEVAVRGFVPSSQSRVNTTQHPTSIKNIQFPKPVSSQSRARHVVHLSPGSSVDAATASSSYNDTVSLESSENNYMNLLHEVVENRGRWTRERWKQNRRMRSVHQSVCKSK
uniref:LRRCT domain-containing protein n=1 Tax=Anolis carolinensis TaxID=28377 RepID=A0A803SZE8_ANOCA|nr:PREDICTED: uncharacterized protein LOC103281116 isoform X2 [Anolis carolinensis]|eukprot:XP_008120175.1 PREDICTED: uncharacterized protein LOC103281116 isoform X2 [Anolis carolinensis]